jgi:hypothetical protein
MFANNRQETFLLAIFVELSDVEPRAQPPIAAQSTSRHAHEGRIGVMNWMPWRSGVTELADR